MFSTLFSSQQHLAHDTIIILSFLIRHSTFEEEMRPPQWEFRAHLSRSDELIASSVLSESPLNVINCCWEIYAANWKKRAWKLASSDIRRMIALTIWMRALPTNEILIFDSMSAPLRRCRRRLCWMCRQLCTRLVKNIQKSLRSSFSRNEIPSLSSPADG